MAPRSTQEAVQCCLSLIHGWNCSGEEIVEMDEDADAELFCVRLNADEVNSKQYMRDMLHTVVHGMTKVESAYVLQKVHSSGSCCVRVCSKQNAQHIVQGLRVRGLNTTLEPFSRSPEAFDTDTQQALALRSSRRDELKGGLLHRVLLHVANRNNMQHMQYVFNVLMMVKEKVTREVAEAVMVEAHATGSALVCICHQDEAQQWLAWLKASHLKCSIQPHW